jgi:hypothetical protein
VRPPSKIPRKLHCRKREAKRAGSTRRQSGASLPTRTTPQPRQRKSRHSHLVKLNLQSKQNIKRTSICALWPPSHSSSHPADLDVRLGLSPLTSHPQLCGIYLGTSSSVASWKLHSQCGTLPQSHCYLRWGWKGAASHPPPTPAQEAFEISIWTR